MRTAIVTFFLLLGLALVLVTGCGNRVEKEVIGVWLIEDISLSGDTNSVDTRFYKDAMEEQKNLRFELREDTSISIFTGAAEIPGTWYYDRKSRQVMVTLEGNMYPTPLGKYQEGILVNSDTNNVGVIITTIFHKLLPVEGEK